MTDWHEIETSKREATLQVLFKVARLLNEKAVARVQDRPGGQSFRAAHTALFPHIPPEGIRLTQLAGRLGITKQAVFQLVRDLEGMGVLERLQDPSDGRAKLIAFSSTGRTAIASGLSTLRELEQDMAAGIGQESWQQLRMTLLRLHDHLLDPLKPCQGGHQTSE
ncbi:MAG: winged helix-turn-helix transcriptional regulator [Acidobacteria bacterium]|nr:winged helix-turn-helix transcriptional regulator [Acidobacteriota bacterium]